MLTSKTCLIIQQFSSGDTNLRLKQKADRSDELDALCGIEIECVPFAALGSLGF